MKQWEQSWLPATTGTVRLASTFVSALFCSTGLKPRSKTHEALRRVAAFSFVGFRVRVVRFWRERNNADSFEWAEGVVKCYSPKYRMVFVHFLLNATKTDVASPSNAPDASLKGEALIPFLSPEETHRSWFSLTADVVRLASKEPVWTRCDVPPPILTPSERARLSHEGLEQRAKAAPETAVSCDASGGARTAQRLCGTCSSPVCCVVKPGVPVETATLCRNLSAETVTRCSPPNSGSVVSASCAGDPSSSSFSAETGPSPRLRLFWGLRCGRCLRYFHAACVKPSHRLTPPPT